MQIFYVFFLKHALNALHMLCSACAHFFVTQTYNFFPVPKSYTHTGLDCVKKLGDEYLTLLSLLMFGSCSWSCRRWWGWRRPGCRRGSGRWRTDTSSECRSAADKHNISFMYRRPILRTFHITLWMGGGVGRAPSPSLPHRDEVNYFVPVRERGGGVGSWEGVGPENQDFFGTWNRATSETHVHKITNVPVFLYSAWT